MRNSFLVHLIPNTGIWTLYLPQHPGFAVDAPIYYSMMDEHQRSGRDTNSLYSTVTPCTWWGSRCHYSTPCRVLPSPLWQFECGFLLCRCNLWTTLLPTLTLLVAIHGIVGIGVVSADLGLSCADSNDARAGMCNQSVRQVLHFIELLLFLIGSMSSVKLPLIEMY